MEHPVLAELLAPIQSLYEDVRRKALMRLEYEGLDKGRPDPASYAMERYAYYVCFKCTKVRHNRQQLLHTKSLPVSYDIVFIKAWLLGIAKCPG